MDDADRLEQLTRTFLVFQSSRAYGSLYVCWWSMHDFSVLFLGPLPIALGSTHLEVSTVTQVLSCLRAVPVPAVGSCVARPWSVMQAKGGDSIKELDSSILNQKFIIDIVTELPS